MTLNQLAGPMTVPFSTRRAAQAAAATLSLMGCRSSAFRAAEAAATHVSVPLGGLTLWATRCDPPLLREEAGAAAAKSRNDVLILRVGTGSADGPPIVFDWIPHRAGSRFGLVPALPIGGGLSLADPHDESCLLDLTGDGIIDRSDMKDGWILARVLAASRAAAILRSNLWGGL
jgi:hypothetical protein